MWFWCGSILMIQSHLQDQKVNFKVKHMDIYMYYVFILHRERISVIFAKTLIQG